MKPARPRVVMQPARPRVLICPHCQAENPLDAERCWICRESLVLVIGADQAALSPGAGSQRTFSLSSLMLLIALVGVCLGVTRELPGVGVVLITVVAPALGRTLHWIKVRKAAGQPMSTYEKLETFGASLGVIFVICISALVAFAVTSFPVGCLVAMTGQPYLMFFAVAVGVVAASFTVLMLGRIFWVTKV